MFSSEARPQSLIFKLSLHFMFHSRDREVVDVLMIRLDESSFGEGDAYQSLYLAPGT